MVIIKMAKFLKLPPSEKNCFLLVFLQLVLVFHMTKATISNTGSVQDKPTNTTENITKVNEVIFDITQARENNIASQHKSSSLMYFVANDNVYNDTCWPIKPNPDKNVARSCGEKYGIAEISFLFSSKHFPLVTNINTSQMTNNTILNLMRYHDVGINTLILNIVDTGSPFGMKFYCFHSEKELTSYLSRNIKLLKLERQEEKKQNKNSVKIGVDYTELLIDSCSPEGFSTLRIVDTAVLRVEISPFAHLLSYGLFSERLDKLVKKNRLFVRSLNPNCELYVRIIYKNYANLTNQVNSRYRALVFKYVEAWVAENKGEENFIVSSFPKNLVIQNISDFLKTAVSPILHQANTYTGKEMSLMQSVSHGFKNLALFPWYAGYCSSFLDCSKIHSNPSDVPPEQKTNLSVIIVQSEVPDVIEIVEKLAKNDQPSNIQTVYFYPWDPPWENTSWNLTLNLLRGKNIQIGCHVKFNGNATINSAEELAENFPFLHSSSKMLLATHNTKDNVKNEQQLVDFLWQVEKARSSIKQSFPGIDPILEIELDYNAGKTGDEWPWSPALLYCEKHKRSYNEYHSGILTFGIIHGWKNLHMRELLEKDHNSWWHTLRTNEEIDEELTDYSYPVFLHTNPAKSLRKEDELPFTYPCVVWTEAAPEMGIGFLSNKYSGTTIDMDLKGDYYHLRKRELKTLLLFAFGKFPTVELVVKRKTDVNIAADVLTKNDLKIPTNSQSVFLEMPIDLYFSTKRIQSLPSHVAVHVTGWESHISDNHSNNNFTMPSSNNTKLGLTLSDCPNQVNTELDSLKKLPFLGSIKYIICNMTPVVPNNFNRNWMGKYLNTLFYIKSYMEKHLPRQGATGNGDMVLEVAFRINLHVEENCNQEIMPFDVEGFLRFLNDVNQHSLAYKTRIFVVQAFPKDDFGYKCDKTWWRIKNYTDLTITTMYTDREEAHFGRPTILNSPPETATGKQAIPESYVILVVLVSVVSFFLFIAVVALWLNYKRVSKKYLTEKQINEFYNGTEVDNSDGAGGKADEVEGQQEENIKWLGMEFPKRFRIPQKNVELGKLIGTGQFGEVFLGKLKEQTDVAIKVPRADSCKETFKNALKEVKILCYVGDGVHPNVILFMGAYTKQIEKGKLYIITEYCTNGPLLSFLRTYQNDFCHGSGDEQVDLYQMYRFAFEIASGMDYISGKMVIHGDLSARNVFLNSDLTCKIGDFGLSRKLYQYTQYVKKSDEPLPWRWMATESLAQREFTTKSDVWSYGVTVWEIFSLGATPYSGLEWSPDFVNELENGMRLPKAKYASAVIHEKLLECWLLISKNRPSFTDFTEYFTRLRNDEYTKLG